jgi:hypothetical protein
MESGVRLGLTRLWPKGSAASLQTGNFLLQGSMIRSTMSNPTSAGSMPILGSACAGINTKRDCSSTAAIFDVTGSVGTTSNDILHRSLLFPLPFLQQLRFRRERGGILQNKERKRIRFAKGAEKRESTIGKDGIRKKFAVGEQRYNQLMGNKKYTPPARVRWSAHKNKDRWAYRADGPEGREPVRTLVRR